MKTKMKAKKQATPAQRLSLQKILAEIRRENPEKGKEITKRINNLLYSE